METYQDEEGARAVDAAFRTVPRDHTAFLVWKITEAGTELLPRTHYGTFYDAEAYLAYSASLPGQPAGPDVIRREIKENGNEYAERHIHAWGGERGGALGALALRRGAQLAAHLGAPAVVHRETATKESPRLLSYFRDGIRILRSGSNSLTSSVRLYRVRGRRPVLIQLEPVSWAQLAADGVFVLDAPALLVLWLGRTANLVEKIFGAKIAYRMARGADKGMTARRIAIAHDGYENTLPPADRALLDALLELRARAVRPATPIAEPPRPARLYKATQSPRPSHLTAPSQRPAARLEEVKRAPLYRSDLADDGVYIVDAGSRGVWAWVGAGAGAAAARGALAAARGLARARRHQGPVSVTPAGREPLEFAALFMGWRWSDQRREGRLRAARCATTRLDAVSLATNSWLAAETQLPDDGSGALRVWRVRHVTSPDDTTMTSPADHSVTSSQDRSVTSSLEERPAGALVDVPQPQAAVFFDRDCYIVLYTYHAPTGDQSILYYWMGGSSPNDLRNLGAKEAKDLYVKLGRLPVQAWVYQGKEPAHFLQIFKGRMITYVGSATDYDPSERRVIPPSRALIRVSGQYSREARGAEVRGSAPGRGSCYILRDGARAWVWCAATATGDEREVAKNMAAAPHTLVMQGNEKDDLWAVLGARRGWLQAAPPREMEKPLPPRLFYAAMGAPGQYSFEEIISFTQYELCAEMACVLDAHCALFVWLGAHAGPRARDHALQLARAYLAQDPAARDMETPVLVLAQGREPPHFTGYFPHWKHNMWKGHKTFNAIISALEGKAIVQGGNSALLSGNSAFRFDQHEKYPPAVLRGARDQLPPDVDPLAKELYLTHDDFVATFSMPYTEFRSLPGWKQRELKKAVGLF
ncbi:villin-like protein quail isoform X2 [Plutella xylostella]|uniref:villin-like protein quail isoform X2 n=1 Tax=Plutella xylostella TaxID=51655 RepID=UPI0020330797|nr:villin-like protein quail isoform X2 [Plutella xylostella]